MNDRERIKYFYEVVVSNLFIQEVPEYVSEDCMVRMGETIIPSGIEGMKQHLMDVRQTYPDLRMKIIRQYCDGDTIISEFIAEGTHGGEWLGIKPTGKKLTFTGVNIDKVINGKMVEHSGAMNTFEALLEQGMIRPS